MAAVGATPAAPPKRTETHLSMRKSGNARLADATLRLFLRYWRERYVDWPRNSRIAPAARVALASRAKRDPKPDGRRALIKLAHFEE